MKEKVRGMWEERNVCIISSLPDFPVVFVKLTWLCSFRLNHNRVQAANGSLFRLDKMMPLHKRYVQIIPKIPIKQMQRHIIFSILI